MRILRAGLIALVSFAAVGVLAVRLSAQGSNGNPILQTIQILQGTVNSLVTSTAPGNVLSTPVVVVFSPDGLSCSITNVSADSHSVSIQLIKNDGTVLHENTATLTAAHTAPFYHVPVSGGVSVYCKVSVNDGTKNDVRVALAVFAAINQSDKLVIAAQ